MHFLKNLPEIFGLILLLSNLVDLFDIHITTNVDVSGNGAQIISPVTNDVQEWQNLPDQPLPPPPAPASPTPTHQSLESHPISFKPAQPTTANIQLETWSPLSLLSTLFPRNFAWYHNVYVPNVIRPAPSPPSPPSSPSEYQSMKYASASRPSPSMEKSSNSIDHSMNTENSEKKINSGFIYKNGRTYIYRWHVVR